MFLLGGGRIHCRVSGARRYSEDLPQGGLEILCVLVFEGAAKSVAKASRLAKYALSTTPEEATKNEPPMKKLKIQGVVLTASSKARD